MFFNLHLQPAPDVSGNISGFPAYLSRMPIEQRHSLGWYSRIDYADVQEAYADPINDRIIAPIPKEPTPIPLKDQYHQISKRKVRELLRKNNVETQFFAILEGADKKWIWDDASYLETNDPDFLALVPVVAGLLGWTDDQVWEHLVAECLY
jgi:hypothetical protein